MMHYGIPQYRLPREGLMQEIERIRAMGVTITCNYRVNDVLAEKDAGRFDAVFLAVGAQVGNHLDIPSMDGGKMIHALDVAGAGRARAARPSSAASSASSAPATPRWTPRGSRGGWAPRKRC